MLQMVNVDAKRSTDYPHQNNSEAENSGDEGGKKDLVLPYINKPNGKLNISDGNINAEEIDGIEHKPKV
jgi:hypothetical protein